MFNPVLLERVFDLRRDGIVILKVLPEGPAQCAHALLLLLYGYHQVKKEYVLATELYRSAEQSQKNWVTHLAVNVWKVGSTFPQCNPR